MLTNFHSENQGGGYPLGIGAGAGALGGGICWLVIKQQKKRFNIIFMEYGSKDK